MAYATVMKGKLFDFLSVNPKTISVTKRNKMFVPALSVTAFMKYCASALHI